MCHCKFKPKLVVIKKKSHQITIGFESIHYPLTCVTSRTLGTLLLKKVKMVEYTYLNVCHAANIAV